MEGPFLGQDPVPSSAVSGTNGSTECLEEVREVYRGGKAIPLKTLVCGTLFFLGYYKEIESCSPPLPQAQDWGSPGGTRGPQGHTGRLCLEGCGRRVEKRARVATVAGVWTRTFFRPPYGLRYSRCPQRRPRSRERLGTGGPAPRRAAHMSEHAPPSPSGARRGERSGRGRGGGGGGGGEGAGAAGGEEPPRAVAGGGGSD